MEDGATTEGPTRKRLAVLSLAALGVVYGDIGTSPLYAFRESFHESYRMPVAPDNVLGVLSLIFWSLILVISIKYLVFVLRADNRGEGGILALAALVTRMEEGKEGSKRLLILLGLFGAALLYGDGMITPAITVLSSVEGLKVATPVFQSYVIPIAVVILVGLFLFQRRGTERVGTIFGPVMLGWFLMLGLLGIYQIVQAPSVLWALSPHHAILFFVHNGLKGMLVLGSIFLVVTGGEALYADLGHFGARPIQIAWFTVVLPGLLLNYFGQGALLIRDPSAVANPFYRMGPGWAIYPMVIMATAAAVIASQAVISGSYSLAMQSMQLGYSPRLQIEHTSEREIGQIYIPEVNWALMIACIGLVIGFKSSSNLAAAYGVAITNTMVITTVLFYHLAKDGWKWPLPAALGLSGLFLLVDLSFWGPNMLKIPAGGWFPLVVAGIVYLLMTTWRSGRRLLASRMKAREIPVTDFIDNVMRHPPTRVPGTAVFMFSDPQGTPRALLHNLKHNRVLHEQVILLAVSTEDVPHLPASERVTLVPRGNGFYTLILKYGFMDDIDVGGELQKLDGKEDLVLKKMTTTYFLGRETLVPSKTGSGMVAWRERLFAFMSHNAKSPTSYFRLPPNQVVEIGARIEL